MENKYTIKQEAYPRYEDVQVLEAGIRQYAMQERGHKPIEFFAFFIRDENNVIRGGCSCCNLYGCLYIGWNKPRSIYEAYLKEQSQTLRSMGVVKINEKFCGYVTVKWQSDYQYFNLNNISEISDLNVLPSYRKIEI